MAEIVSGRLIVIEQSARLPQRLALWEIHQMADKDLNAQLKDLRRQLDELVRRQEQDRAARSAAQEAAPLGAEGDAKPTSTRPEWPRRLQQQFEELLHHLKTELNEVPAASALTVFALGVLVGRLISK